MAFAVLLVVMVQDGTSHAVDSASAELYDMSGRNCLPRVTIELAALVHPENKINVLAGPVGLVKDALVVSLCRP